MSRHAHKYERRLARERGAPIGHPQHRLVSEIRQAWLADHERRGTVARGVDGIGAQPDIGGMPVTRNDPIARPRRHRLRRHALTAQEIREIGLREIELSGDHPGLADLQDQEEDEKSE